MLHGLFVQNQVWSSVPHALRSIACARLPGFTQLKTTQGAAWDALKQDCLRHYNTCPVLFEHPSSLWPGTMDSISRGAILNDLLFKITVRSDRLCILVSGLLDAFVAACNLQRTHCHRGLSFRELMYGRSKMMTALCRAWAHTYQTSWLGIQIGATQT